MGDKLPLRPAPDASGADWLANRMENPWHRQDGSVRVGAIIPAGFEAYARIFHPGRDRVTGQRVPWHEVAARFGRVPHAEMQWHRIAASREAEEPDSGLLEEPIIGHLPPQESDALVDVLRGHTQTPDQCWFAVWEGWGTPVPLVFEGTQTNPKTIRWSDKWPFCDASSFSLPGRRYYLVQGHIDAASALVRWNGASLWWPEDHSWCVATEVDYMEVRGRASNRFWLTLVWNPGRHPCHTGRTLTGID